MEYKTKVNLLGVYLFLILLGLISIAILIYRFKIINNNLTKILIYIACSGGIGGTIYSIKGFYQNIAEGKFDFNLTWRYIFGPIVGGVMGIFAYFLIVGGLLSICSNPNLSHSKSTMFYSAIAFLAGFSFIQFTNKLGELASTLFAKKENKK